MIKEAKQDNEAKIVAEAANRLQVPQGESNQEESSLYSPREAASQLGVGYSTFKKQVHRGVVRVQRTPGGH